jgi:DNA-binding NarL/FixJ family response regulator
MKKIRILIADDHPVVRSGLRGMLESQTDFEVAGEAGDGAEAERMTRGLTPDVVLMDLRMPQIDGVEAIRTIKKSRPETAILVLTTYDSEADIVFAVEAGASGYLLKDVGPEELFNGILSGRGEENPREGQDAGIRAALSLRNRCSQACRPGDAKPGNRRSGRRQRGDGEVTLEQHLSEARGERPHRRCDHGDPGGIHHGLNVSE